MVSRKQRVTFRSIYHAMIAVTTRIKYSDAENFTLRTIYPPGYSIYYPPDEIYGG